MCPHLHVTPSLPVLWEEQENIIKEYDAELSGLVLSWAAFGIRECPRLVVWRVMQAPPLGSFPRPGRDTPARLTHPSLGANGAAAGATLWALSPGKAVDAVDAPSFLTI